MFLAVCIYSILFSLHFCFCTGNWRQKQYATISMKLSRQVKRSILKYYITRKVVSLVPIIYYYKYFGLRFDGEKQDVRWGKNFSFANIMTSSFPHFHVAECRNDVLKMKNKHVIDDITTDEFIFTFLFL